MVNPRRDSRRHGTKGAQVLANEQSAPRAGRSAVQQAEATGAPGQARRRRTLRATHQPLAALRKHGCRRPSLPAGQTVESPHTAVIAAHLGATELVRRLARGRALSRAPQPATSVRLNAGFRSPCKAPRQEQTAWKPKSPGRCFISCFSGAAGRNRTHYPQFVASNSLGKFLEINHLRCLPPRFPGPSRRKSGTVKLTLAQTRHGGVCGELRHARSERDRSGEN